MAASRASRGPVISWARLFWASLLLAPAVHIHGAEHAHEAESVLEEHADAPTEGHGEEGHEETGLEHSGQEGHEEGHGHGHGHGHASSFDPSATILLYGCLITFMAFIYLTQSSSLYVREYTWRLVGDVIAIFIAVLIYQTLTEGMRLLAHMSLGTEESEAGSVTQKRINVFVAAVLLVCVLLCVIFSVHCLRSSRWWVMSSVMKMLAHVVGFASIQLIGMLQDFFVGSNRYAVDFGQRMDGILLSLLAWAIGSAVVLLLLIGWMFMVRMYGLAELLTELDSSEEEGSSEDGESIDDVLAKLPENRRTTEERLEEEVMEFQADAWSLSTGYALVRVICFAISGHLPVIMQNYFDHTILQVILMLAVAVAFSVCALIVASCPEGDGFQAKVIEQVQTLLNMIAAWSWVTTFRWFTYSVVDANYLEQYHLLVQVGMAMSGTFFGAAIAVTLALVRDHGIKFTKNGKGLRDMVLILGIYIGLKWEMTFDAAVEGLAELPRPWCDLKVVVHICMIALMLPAFVFHVHPMVVEADEIVRKRRRAARVLED